MTNTTNLHTFDRLRQLTIVQQNVQSWNTNRHSLTNIYNDIDPDIILLNETSVLQNERLTIFNYNIYRTNHSDERHSGAAIAIRRNLTAKVDDDFYQDFLTATLETAQGPVTIATGYIPPRLNYINTADLYKIFNRRHPVYLLADLNAYHRHFDYTADSIRGKQIVTMIGTHDIQYLGPHFKTRITGQTRRSPDIVLANDRAYLNIHLKPGPLTPSDHSPIIAKLSYDPIQIPINRRFQFSKTNWTEYKDILSNFRPDISRHETLEDIDEHVKTFNDKILDATKRTTPLLTYRTIPGIQPNRQINRLQQTHNNLMTVIATLGTTPIRHRLLLDLRTQLRDEYNRLYSKTWDNIIDKIDTIGDVKAFFNSIKRMTGNSTEPSPFLRHNGQTYNRPQDQEPIYRQYWTTIFSADDPDENEFDYEHIDAIEDTLNNRIDQIIPYDHGDLTRLNQTCPPIAIDDVKDKIKKMKHKAPGPNGLTALQLKMLPDNMTKYLTDIYNQTLSAGYFPDYYKDATMVLIPKGQGTTIKDRRPISLLNLDGKILDRILNDRLTAHLRHNNLTNDRQHGFTHGRGTQTAIMTFHETISKDLGQKHKIDVVCRDVSKAFDRIWHTGLKYKLTETNLHDCYKRILCDFVTDRTARIKIGGHTGQTIELETGVPQGACLSPTLFNFYVHDLPDPLPNTDYIQYADDITQIISAPGDYRFIGHQTTYAIRQLNDFENKWKIQTNIDKFSTINIARYKTDALTINDNDLTYKRNAKILGLTFSNRGPAKQVSIRRAIARRTQYKLYRFRRLSTYNKRRLYLTIVRPQLLYPIIPLNTSSKTSISKLQTVQNAGLRFIENVKLTDRIPAWTLHERHDIPPINQYLHDRSIKTWKLLDVKNPDIFDRIKPTNEDRYNRHTYFPCSFRTDDDDRPPPAFT